MKKYRVGINLDFIEEQFPHGYLRYFIPARDEKEALKIAKKKLMTYIDLAVFAVEDRDDSKGFNKLEV